MEFRRVAKGVDGKKLARRLVGSGAGSGCGLEDEVEVLKVGGDGSCVVGIGGGEGVEGVGRGGGVVVKVRVVGGGRYGLKKSLDEKCVWLGWGSRGWRQMRGGLCAESHGARTAAVLGLGVGLLERRVCEVVVSRRVVGLTVLEWMALSGSEHGFDVEREHAVARAVGLQIGLLAKGGVLDRDHKGSNLVVEIEEDGGIGVVLVDPVGVRRRRFVCAEDRVARMLASLLTEAVGCGVVPRRGVLMRAALGAVEGCGLASGLDREGRRVVLRDVVGRVFGFATLDSVAARPKVDPLARLRGEVGF